MSDIPDGVNSLVAAMTIAWEMTKRTKEEFATETTQEDELEKWLSLYEKAYKRILKVTA